MSSLAVRDAIKRRIEELNLLPYIDMENDTATPPNTLTPWVTVQYPGAVEGQITFGNPGADTFREEGTFIVHIMVPTGTKLRDALTYAEDFRNTFRSTRFDGVRVHTADAPTAEKGATMAGNGNWAGVAFAVDYDFDILR